jgi:predicted ATPase
VVSSGEKSGLLDLLRGVDAQLIDLEIITEAGDRPLLTALFTDGRRVPVTVLGDGFRRALAIAMAINQVRGGLLLIDEIETAMHVSALDVLFPWLVQVAYDNDVQIFATTHSLEAIQAISTAAQVFGDAELTAFHLPSRTRSSRSQLRRYTGSMLTRLVQERGLDIR